MFRRLLTPGLLVALAIAVVAAACGGNPASPSTPPSGGPQTDLSTGGSGATGVDANGSKGKGAKSTKVHGLVSALTGSCPTVTFTVNGKTVKTTPETAFHGVGCSNLKNGGRVEVKGATQTDGSIVASFVTVNGEGENDETELKGTISGLTGTCPTLTFTVNGTSVATTAQTTFKKTGCGDVKNGIKVEIEGLMANGRMTAVTVSADD